MIKRNKVQLFGYQDVGERRQRLHVPEINVVDFADGTKKVQIPELGVLEEIKKFKIMVRPNSMDDIMVAGLIVDIIRRNTRLHSIDVGLVVMSPMYQRYDRVMHTDSSDALGAMVYAKVIHSLGFDTVCLVDAHSGVLGECLEQLGVTIEDSSDGLDCLHETLNGDDGNDNFGKALSGYVIVSPDAGAAKRLGSFAKVFCDKSRCPETGKIAGIKVASALMNDQQMVEGKQELLIVDDICEKGGTFFGVAGALEEFGFTVPVNLYVTHGIFAEGTNLKLMAKLFKNIFVHSMSESDYYRAVQIRDKFGGNFYCKNVFKDSYSNA